MRGSGRRRSKGPTHHRREKGPRRGFPWRNALVAIVAIGTALALYFAFGASDSLNLPVRRWTAVATAWALNVLGTDASLEDTAVAAGGFRFLVVNDCTPVGPILLLWGAMLAFPARWTTRLAGMALGALALTALNLVRMVSLLYLGILAPDYLEVGHLLVWQSLMVLAAILLWLLWFQRVARGHAH